MANSRIENVEIDNVILSDAISEDNLLTFAAAGTVASGTILARNTSTLKLIPYVKGGVTDGDGIPVAIIAYDVEATAAGDEAVRAAISGKFRKEQCIIDADGDDSNIDAIVTDLLRDYGLILTTVTELNIQDNQ